MNALNLLTMLSGSVGKENLGRLFQGEDKTSGDFATTLMAQIGLLAQSESQENLTLPMTDLAELTEQLTQLTSFDSEQMSSAMQEIAGLLGNKLPASGSFDQEIDLEKTMRTLNEVLSHIEAATESSAGMFGNVDRAETDEARIFDLSAEEGPTDMPVTTMPLSMIKNPDETILAVDANPKLPLEDLDDTGTTDGEGNIPKLIRDILQTTKRLERTVLKNMEAIPVTTMPLSIIKNPDETILAVDANTKLPLEDQDDTGIADGEGNIPKLIRDILQTRKRLERTVLKNMEAMPVTTMPLSMIKNPDETILAVDANTKLPLEDLDDTGTTDGEGNIPKLIKNILQTTKRLERTVLKDAQAMPATMRSDHNVLDNTQAIPVSTMPLNIIKSPDETILAVDANTKLPLENQSDDTGITDSDGNIPKLIKNILQNGEELSNGKSLIEEQRLAGESKVSTDAKAVDLHAKTDSETASIEKKLAPSAAVEKPVPKMALDMAQLHRQIAGQTKIEAPAMSKPMAHPEWDQELGERIVWMNNRAMPFAELKLNPQHLGPISIRIDMNQDQTTIAFSAQQAAVKEAIEAAIPKLREMMGAQQLNVAEISVTQASLGEQAKLPGFGQAAQQQNEGGQKNSRGPNAFGNSDSAANASEDVDNANAIVSSGILNLFA
ncbi:flagellar hook-length control protein FliK [Methylotuvimicrobium buryatense]|uniref:Flagellar hook-length control protein FliK n=1 Tax=Methylotuvimicrobium buryatense TaxID=95641 RepID=A0A4P9UQ07_METBY|nr:flagellar hook-length control protein FliK [Methylotuvimicrobium buryatense]QCW81666.1 flagellar hook-length control protein FliK [Methylotuvimicrobium buryatense]